MTTNSELTSQLASMETVLDNLQSTVHHLEQRILDLNREAEFREARISGLTVLIGTTLAKLNAITNSSLGLSSDLETLDPETLATWVSTIIDMSDPSEMQANLESLG